MIGAKFDLVGPYAMVKGLPWSFELTRKAGGQPLDLTGCAARLVIIDVLDPTAPALEFSTASGHIVLGGAAGTITIELPETLTAFAATRVRYRLYFTDSLGREGLLLRGRLGILEDGE